MITEEFESLEDGEEIVLQWAYDDDAVKKLEEEGYIYSGSGQGFSWEAHLMMKKEMK